MTPPPPRRASTPPARSRLVVTIADPADVCEVQILVAREAFEENPGETEVRFHVGGKILLLPMRVHVGPKVLKGLAAAAGPSWKWETVTAEPTKRTPPPARRTA